VIVDTVSACVRTVLLWSLLQAAGAALYLALFGHALSRSIACVRRLGLISAGSAVVAVAAFYLVEAARMAGEFSGMLDPELRALALTANLVPAGARAAGVVMLLAGFASGRSRSVGIVGALMVAFSFAATGHTMELVPREPAAVLIILHVLLGSAWFGALLPLYLATRYEPAAAAANAVQKFTALATWSVPLIAIAGVVLAWWLGVRPAHLGGAYVQLVALKFTGFAVLMLLAAANKWRLGPRLATGDASAAQAFRRSVAVEYVVIVSVLAATATLTTFYAPG
jgi:putative copper export protein